MLARRFCLTGCFSTIHLVVWLREPRARVSAEFGFSGNWGTRRRLCHESTAKDHGLHRKRRRLHRQARRRYRMAKSPAEHSRLRHERAPGSTPTGSSDCATALRGSLRIPHRNLQRVCCNNRISRSLLVKWRRARATDKLSTVLSYEASESRAVRLCQAKTRALHMRTGTGEQA